MAVVVDCSYWQWRRKAFQTGGGALHSMEDSRGAREKTSDKKTVPLYYTLSATFIHSRLNHKTDRIGGGGGGHMGGTANIWGGMCPPRPPLGDATGYWSTLGPCNLAG